MVVERLIFSWRLGMRWLVMAITLFMEDLELGTDLVMGISLSLSHSVVNPWCVGLTVLLVAGISTILWWQIKCLDLSLVVLLEHRRELVLNMP